MSSALLASNVLSAYLGISEECLLNMSKQNASELLGSKMFAAKDAKKLKSGRGKKDAETAAGGDAMGPGGLIEGWVVTEEMKLETLNKDPKASCDLMMLKSDFLLDFAESLFKHQK